MERGNKPKRLKKFYSKGGNFSNQGQTEDRNNRGSKPNNAGIAGVNQKASCSNNNALEIIALNPNVTIGPYKAWKDYFPCDEYDKNSDIVNKLEITRTFLMKIMEFKRHELKAKNTFTINVGNVKSDVDISAKWPQILTDLKNNPQFVIDCFSLCMHQILFLEMEEFLQQPLDSESDEEDGGMQCVQPLVRVQFSGFEISLFKNLKVNTYNKFVSIRGTVIRVGNVNTFCAKLSFSCTRCKNVQLILQPNGNYTAPNHCILKGCQSRCFEPLRQSNFTEMVSWQSVCLQEVCDDDNLREKGRVPRTIECELQKDLVDHCIPGDIVTVSGIVKVADSKKKLFGTAKKRSIYVFYILANYVECMKDKKADSLDVMPGGLNPDLYDLYVVRDIHNQENKFNLIIASLCPNIYGNEIIKAGLVLSLFGGSQRYIDDSNRVSVRGNSHILIVGDPGLGKSQMLLACANASPRGVYVCGNTSTSCGLTVTVTREAGGGNRLDAGALILADQGCCCIDEFDKMTNQHNALLEPMEQQTISIAKCGMSCILPARTSIIAAANPVEGHYNKAKTVTENIKLSSALLSRFDLVFIAIDKADMELDTKLSAYVMAMHNGTNQSALVPTKYVHSTQSACSLLEGKNALNNHFKLNSDQDLIPVEQLKTYIAYARKYVQPKVSPEAASILQEFYIDLRKQHHQSPNSIPITNRQLESMIRLTEAHARIELREVCTAEDAQEIVNIMKYSMADIYSDEFSNIDFERSTRGSGSSKQAKTKRFLSVLNSFAKDNNNAYFTLQQLKDMARNLGIDMSKFDELVESLNYQGYLIKKGPKLYWLQTV